ncbi:SLATT domain-containing protein [Streptomyces sp. NPDC057575]|uniref:SLATT domain-containing protein n=1 Tax=unclassified Streptomyces TaxID=2593676 RepID=UPI0036A44FB7
MSLFGRMRGDASWQHSDGSAFPGDVDGEGYVAELKRGVDIRRRRRRKLTRSYWALRILVIATGIAIAAISATSAPKWLLGLLGSLAAGVETVLTAANLQKRAVLHAFQADRVSRELRAFELGVSPYDNPNKMQTLFTKVEALRDDTSSHSLALEDENLPQLDAGAQEQP